MINQGKRYKTIELVFYVYDLIIIYLFRWFETLTAAYASCLGLLTEQATCA